MSSDGAESGSGLERDPIEVLDERIEYLDGYTPRDKSHEQRLQQRKRELEIVKERMLGEADHV